MNIKLIKEIIEQGLPREVTEKCIIDVLAKDEKVLDIMFEIVISERERKKEIYSEMNLLLSKAESGMETKLNKDKFIQKEINEFYEKNSNEKGVFHCFKNK